MKDITSGIVTLEIVDLESGMSTMAARWKLKELE